VIVSESELTLFEGMFDDYKYQMLTEIA